VYDVRITPEGLRQLTTLPTKIRDAALVALSGSIGENPQRSGKRLVGELTGLYSARRGDYRIIYAIDDDTKVVVVHRIQHRGAVYRKR
jgi:mRNA-degrading endonuclease RelE of RelBE toxin-antitoxin system